MPEAELRSHSSNAAYHTYEMEADALSEAGHSGFRVNAQAMASLLFDFATDAAHREAVKKEFEGIRALFSEYQKALRQTYAVPNAPDPK